MRPFDIAAQLRPSSSRATVLGFAIVAILLTSAATAATTASGQDMAWGTMTMNLLGGLALFLFGMEQMSEALKAVAGERMKLILAKLTTNRFMGAVTGASNYPEGVLGFDDMRRKVCRGEILSWHEMFWFWAHPTVRSSAPSCSWRDTMRRSCAGRKRLI